MTFEAYAGNISWKTTHGILTSYANTTFSTSEAYIVSSPTNNNNLIAGFNDNNQGRCRTVTSSDGGNTWGGATYIPLPSNTPDSSDPVLSQVNNLGSTFYINCVGLTFPYVSPNGHDHIVIDRTTDSGSHWSIVAQTNRTCTSSSACPFDDKPWIKASGNNVYLCWTKFDDYITTTTAEHILFQNLIQSGGPTFLANGTDTGNASTDRVVQGCNIAINSKGVVYVAWAHLTSSTAETIELRRSFDNGTTFDAVQTVATFTRTPTPLGNCNFAFGCVQGITSGGMSTGINAPDFPQMAFDNQNNLHIVFVNYNTSTLTDVRYTNSTSCNTHGSSCIFSTPVNVANDNGLPFDEFLPAITYSAGNNTVDITALDRRSDANNVLWQPTHYHCHLSLGKCTSTSAWSSGVIVPDQSNNFDGGSRIGDYYNVMSNGAHEDYPVWVDSRTVSSVQQYRIWNNISSP